MEFGGRIGMDKEVSVLGDGSGGAPDSRRLKPIVYARGDRTSRWVPIYS